MTNYLRVGSLITCEINNETFTINFNDNQDIVNITGKISNIITLEKNKKKTSHLKLELINFINEFNENNKFPNQITICKFIQIGQNISIVRNEEIIRKTIADSVLRGDIKALCNAYNSFVEHNQHLFASKTWNQIYDLMTIDSKKQELLDEKNKIAAKSINKRIVKEANKQTGSLPSKEFVNVFTKPINELKTVISEPIVQEGRTKKGEY